MGVADEAHRLDKSATEAVEKLVLGGILGGQGAHSRPPELAGLLHLDDARVALAYG